MIKAIIIVNNHGKPRLTKFYTEVDEEQQQSIVRRIFQQVRPWIGRLLGAGTDVGAALLVGGPVGGRAG